MHVKKMIENKKFSQADHVHTKVVLKNFLIIDFFFKFQFYVTFTYEKCTVSCLPFFEKNLRFFILICFHKEAEV